MFKKIRNFFLTQELTHINEQITRIKEMRAKLVYRPALEDIPDKLDQCEKLGKQLRKLKKKKKELESKLGGVAQG